MASDTARRLSSPRRHRRCPAATIIFVGCALALAFVPVAAARPGSARPVDRAGVPNPADMPSAAVASPEPGERGSGHIEPTGPGDRRRAPGQRPESARHPVASRGPATSPVPVPHHAAGTAGATRSIPRSAPSAAPGKAPAAPPTAARAPIRTLPRAAMSTAAAPAARTPASATPTPTAATLQLAGGSHPVLTSGTPRAARGPRHARSRAARRHTAPVASSPGALAPVAAIPFTPAHFTPAHGKRARPAQRAAHGSPAPGRRLSPIVTTITRIVGVVPTLVWVLIGVLCTVALRWRYARAWPRCARGDWSASVENCSRTWVCCRPRCCPSSPLGSARWAPPRPTDRRTVLERAATSTICSRSSMAGWG